MFGFSTREASLALVIVLLLPGVVRGAIWDPFSGFVDLSAVQSQIDDVEQETFRQEYNLVFMKKVTPLVDLRLSARYYKFDQDLELILGNYRQEFQPSGEVRWSHPWFLATVSGFRRSVRTSNRTEILTNDIQASIQTVDQRYPRLELRYDRQHTYTPEIPEEQDIQNSRLQANADYRTDHHIFNYSFSHILSENVISDLTARADRHLFRWEGFGKAMNDDLDFSARYSFNHGSQESEVRGSGPLLELAPIAIGLYALNDSPDLGRLEPRPGLADGNTTDPVEPRIDIGGGGNGHNLGADLGNTQFVAAMYVYTDRPSGEQVRWLIYGSQDNLTWDPWSQLPSQTFNPALNRYELTFPGADYRYVKAVNAGINEVVLVYVTEIQVFRQLPEDTNETTLTAVSHQMDARAGYRFGRRWQTSVDLSAQVDDNIGRRGDRWRNGLGWRLLFDQSAAVSHSVRYVYSRQGGEDPEPTLLDNVLGYTLTADPLERLHASFSLSDRWSQFDGARSQDILNSVAEVRGGLYPGLNVTLGGGVSWFDDYLVDREYRVWNGRVGMDAALSRSLDLVVDYNYTETHEQVEDGFRTRSLGSIGVDWRITRTLFFRSSIRYTAQRTRTWTQDHLLSWNLLPSVRISAQLFQIETDDVRTTYRRSANLNWSLGARTWFYFRVAEVDFAGPGGTSTNLFQQGFRLSF